MNRYSRQNLTYGNSATEKLFYSKVVLIGLGGGLATEIAKNLLLSGLNKLWLLDLIPNENSDIFETHFLCLNKDLGVIIINGFLNSLCICLLKT